MNNNLGFTSIVLLAFFFVFMYLIGRRENFKRQRVIWNHLSNAIKPYSKKVGFKSLGSSAFQLSVPRGKLPFKQLEVTVLLLDRENLIHYLILKSLKRRDRAVVKADFKVPPDFSVEVYQRKMKGVKIKEDFKDVKLKAYSDMFQIKASNPGKAMNLLIKLQKNLVKETTEKFSVSNVTPHLIYVCHVNEQTIRDLLPFLTRVGKAVEKLSVET